MEGGLKLHLSNGETATVPSRKALARICPSENQLPKACDLFDNAITNGPTQPIFFPIHAKMFAFADEQVHKFYGSYERPQLRWVWGEQGVRGYFKPVQAYEYFGFPTRAAFVHYFEQRIADPPPCPRASSRSCATWVYGGGVLRCWLR